MLIENADFLMRFVSRRPFDHFTITVLSQSERFLREWKLSSQNTVSINLTTREGVYIPKRGCDFLQTTLYIVLERVLDGSGEDDRGGSTLILLVGVGVGKSSDPLNQSVLTIIGSLDCDVSPFQRVPSSK